MPHLQWKKSVDLWLVLAIIFYFFAAQAGLLLTFEISKESILWPPPGLAFALLLFWGKRIWPGIIIGSILAHLIWFLHIDVTLSPTVIYCAVLMSAGQTLEALLGYFLIKKVIGEFDGFSKTNHAFSFLFIVLIMCLVGASVSTLGMFSGQLLPSDETPSFFFFKWVSNVVSILVITPFLLSWKWRSHIQLGKTTLFETAFFVILAAGVLYLNTILSIKNSISSAIPFLLIPLLLWITFRFNLKLIMTLVVATAFTSIYITINKSGPFYLYTEENSMILNQIYIGMISITALILHATIRERNEVQNHLKNFNEKLESMVTERTKKLEEEIVVRKKMEEKTKSSNRRLKKTNTELDHFVYSVSHDLRAPIASILGLTNLAKSETDMKSVKEIISKIQNSASQQDKFIGEILDISRNARLVVKAEKVNFSEIVDEAFEYGRYGYPNKNIEKELDIRQEGPFSSDKQRLKVIFNNLIANSLRYTNGKKPLIKVSIQANDKIAHITITDNGIGIGKEHLDKIFKMFYRATDEGAGSGLGLYIVKEALDKLKGEIKIESTPKKGTKVMLEIPQL